MLYSNETPRNGLRINAFIEQLIKEGIRVELYNQAYSIQLFEYVDVRTGNSIFMTRAEARRTAKIKPVKN